MTVYDTAHELARQLSNSLEYKEYKQKKGIVDSNSELKAKVEEFEKIKYEVQKYTLQGKEQDQEKLVKLQELYTILLQNKDIKEYFDTQIRFNVLLADVNKIIGESVKDVLQ